MCAFLIGSFFFHSIESFGWTGKEEFTCFESFLIQSFIFIVSAAVVQPGVVINRPTLITLAQDGNTTTTTTKTIFMDRISIASFSIQAAGQLLDSLQISEVPNVVLTMIVSSLASDVNILEKRQHL